MTADNDAIKFGGTPRNVNAIIRGLKIISLNL